MSKSSAKKKAGELKRYERNQQKIKNSGLVILSTNKYLCKVCGNEMRIKRKLLVKNPICRNCMTGQSFGEEKTIEILKKYKIHYEKEKTFGDLKGIGGKKLRFDFYIKGENRNFILEIDGEQHKNDVDWGLNTKEHDIIKNKYCNDKKLQLYRIAYKHGKLGKLENDLMKVIKAEFSENYLIVNKVSVEKNKVMTDEEIEKVVNKHKEKSKPIPKNVPEVENIVVGMKVTVKLTKWLAKTKNLDKIERGIIKAITEKAILLKNEEETWLPKSHIKIYN